MSNPFTAKANKPSPFTAKAKKTNPKSNGKSPTNPFSRRVIRSDDDKIHGGIRHPGSEKADFMRDGIRFCNPRDHGSYWSVDVVNGEDVFTFHNKHGSWMMNHGSGWREPGRGIAFGLQDRWVAELKRIGAQLPYYLRTEADKRKSDSRKGDPVATSDEKPMKKRSKKKASKPKENPWTKRAKSLSA